MSGDPLKTYEAVSKDGAAATKGLMLIWDRLGNPTDCSTSTGWIMVDNIIQVWRTYWPWEEKDWVDKLKFELGTERTVQEALKENGGYFPVSYPTRLYKMVHTILPDQKLNDMKFLKGLTSRYPFLKTTNAKL